MAEGGTSMKHEEVDDSSSDEETRLTSRFTNKWKILHLAARNGNEFGVEYFLSKNKNVNGVDEDGKTPLHYAVMNSDEDSCLKIVQLLLKNGADPNIKDKNGQRPLDIAKDVKWFDKLKLIIEQNKFEDGQGTGAL